MVMSMGYGLIIQLIVGLPFPVGDGVIAGLVGPRFGARLGGSAAQLCPSWPVKLRI